MNGILEKCVKLVVCCLLLTLAGCVKQVGCNNNKACQNMCAKRFAYCEKTCDNSCHQCVRKSLADAQTRYERYYQEQKITGGMLMRELLSFHDPLQCAKTTCNCIADKQLCLQGDSKHIYKHLQVIPACG